MKRKCLIILTTLIILSAIIFLVYNIYNYIYDCINYIPRITSVEESNMIENK